jgi:protein-disulfide isomerase
MFALKVPVNDDRTLEVAKSIGLDPVQVKKEMESEEIDKILKHNIDLAQVLGVNGTPGFIIGDTLVPGAVDLKDLQAAVSSLRKS